ncbi:hypothetical protein AVEN_186808-1 [Araneus ventricosus]|uniref:CCHC-type domain-containing protein n=1 Tax=Araneus ventricosus TaxID=182803 RepID=A0A4Y2FB06_ARAVE|nr:hypothetical protein AVEN_186808-1 [Araneus ventricosus]
MTQGQNGEKRLFDDSGLYFEFSRCKIDNLFGVKQCKHCRRFGHTTKWCPRAKEVLCGHCGCDHPTENCKEIICINYKESNQRTASSFDFKHRSKCESFQKQKANLVRLTDYGAP